MNLSSNDVSEAITSFNNMIEGRFYWMVGSISYVFEVSVCADERIIVY